MKKQLLFLTSFLFVANIVGGQSNDLQWLIFDGKGKTLVSAASMNVFPTTNIIGTSFTIAGVTLPISNPDHAAGNDLFVIYKDGNHFNSRNKNFTDRFYTEGPLSSVKAHNFNNTYSQPILYAYLSNVYEEDDLPQGVAVTGGYSGGNPIPYSLSTIKPDILSASHNVVIDKDITIVINYDSLTTLLGPEAANLILTYNGVQLYNDPGGAIVEVDILDLQPVFKKLPVGYTHDFPDASLTANSKEYVTFGQGVGKYRYLNLRPTDTAEDFGPNSDGTPKFNAVFSLKRFDGTTYRFLKEPIMFAYDPNFLRVDSICANEDGSNMIYYHLQFENVSPIAAAVLTAKVIFPPDFDMDCLEAIKWSAGGMPCTGTKHISANSCKFVFEGNNSLVQCNSGNSTSCIGYVEFKVKTNAGYDVTDLDNSLALNGITVEFNGIPFQLDDFYDLKEIKDSLNVNPPSFTFYRPFKTGSCSECDGGGLSLEALLAIIAALGILGILLTFRRRIFG